jgi:1-acyl-sn-glycerol-3-phosphate acyltransferase
VLWLLRGGFGWRVQARPPAAAPRPDQPLVVVFNHTSNVDAFLVVDTIWRRLRHWCQPLVKAELFDVPGLGTLARQAGAIPVTRTEGTAREAAYDDAVARLRAGGTILVAPEGTVTHDGSLLPLRHGAARLALEAGVDVLVVTHFGAQRGFSPVVRSAERGVVVTMAMDVLSPWPDEDATSLTGRIAATMLDRSEELRAGYPQADPGARWWPPYSAPASPSATARENLERYRESMAEAVAHARERMARIAEDHEVEQRVAQARERGVAAAEELAARSRARAETLAEQARHRFEELSSAARDRPPDHGHHGAPSNTETPGSDGEAGPGDHSG